MSEHYDIVIRNCVVVDGTGKPPFIASIGINDKKIVSVGKVNGTAEKTIDGTGCTVCPGFIDSHSHADLSILNHPCAENLIMQGITTFVGGHCGISLAPLDDMSYFQTLKSNWGLETDPGWKTFSEWTEFVENEGIGPNYIPLVGHNALRGAVMGERYTRAADRDEIDAMNKLLEEAMASGAFGVSMGLDANSPGHFAERNELLLLLKTVKDLGGLFSPHTRHHQNQWPSESPAENAYGLYQGPKGELFTGRYHGLKEALELAEQADNIRLLIAHLTPSYSIPQPHPAFVDEALARATLSELIDTPSKEGLEVYFNVIPCEYSIGSRAPVAASFFNRNLALPEWLASMRREDFAGKLKDRAFADQVKDYIYSGTFKFGMINPVTDPYWMDCFQVLESGVAEAVGKTIGELARERASGNMTKAVFDESIEIVFELIIDDVDSTWAMVRDKREYGVLSSFLTHPKAIPMTDVHALPADPEAGRGIFGYGISPAAYAMFPNYLSEFVMEKKLLSLEEAVMKITSLPAREVFNIRDRGTVEEGMYADLVLLDLNQLEGHHSFLSPAYPPKSVQYVFINGSVAYEKGKHTGVRSGSVLRMQ